MPHWKPPVDGPGMLCQNRQGAEVLALPTLAGAGPPMRAEYLPKCTA
jgi:hypothetical protein